jgi:galacturonosyltransferase
MRNNILFLTNNSSGLYGFRKELIQALAEKNTVSASTPDDGNIEDLNAVGCRVILTDIDRRGINPVTDLKLFVRYWKMLRQEKPHMVITYTIKPNIYGGLACRLLGIPYAANITGLGTAFQKEGLLRKLVVALYKLSLKKARVVFFENFGNRQVFLDEGIVAAENTCLLSGAGVNLERFEYKPYPETAPVRFLFVGRVMKEKGVEELFEAMKRLRAEGFDCCLDMLGESEEDYTKVLGEYEAGGWVRFHGFQNDVRPFIENAHCFVLPSYHEGMANTNLECAAMGRPVITSDIPGCREAVVEGVSGLLCESQNAHSLYDAMKRFMLLPNEARARMGRAGRQHMEAVFDKNVVVRNTMNALNR